MRRILRCLCLCNEEEKENTREEESSSNHSNIEPVLLNTPSGAKGEEKTEDIVSSRNIAEVVMIPTPEHEESKDYVVNSPRFGKKMSFNTEANQVTDEKGHGKKKRKCKSKNKRKTENSNKA